jgi:hypothetical protein
MLWQYAIGVAEVVAALAFISVLPMFFRSNNQTKKKSNEKVFQNLPDAVRSKLYPGDVVNQCKRNGGWRHLSERRHR